MIEAAKQLDDSYTIDIYGPITEPELSYLKDEPCYKGILKGAEVVMKTLSTYDVVVLPTYYEGEGYPGVIVEAYSLSMPVISTNWQAIPEIIEDGDTGLLIKPHSIDSLVEAINSFDEQKYEEMSKNALAYYFRNFQIREVMSSVLDQFGVLINT